MSLDVVLDAVQPVLGHYQVPGAVIAAAHGNHELSFLALGTDAHGMELAPDTLFPVASITKLATALAALRLVDAGKLDLDAELAQYLPDAAAAKPGVRVRMLLSHSSGLPEDVEQERAPYAPGLDWPMAARACLDTTLEASPFTRVRYSNVGYGLLATIVERATGKPFAEALTELVLRPLDVEAYLGTEPARPMAVLADVRGSSAGTSLEPYNSTFWRGLALPWGGLITDAAGACALVRVFAGHPPGFISQSLSTAAISNQNDDLPGGYGPPFMYERCPWGLGPDLRDEKVPHWAPAESSPDTFGHAGASGCVAWCDPAAQVAWAILGSRTADNGWLLRGSPSIGAAILQSGS